MLWETGARIGEVLDLKIESISDHGHGVEVLIQGRVREDWRENGEPSETGMFSLEVPLGRPSGSLYGRGNRDLRSNQAERII